MLPDEIRSFDGTSVLIFLIYVSAVQQYWLQRLQMTYLYSVFHRLNMELDIQSLFGLHVHNCAHCTMADTPQPPPRIWFGLIYEGAIGPPRWTTSLCNLLLVALLRLEYNRQYILQLVNMFHSQQNQCIVGKNCKKKLFELRHHLNTVQFIFYTRSIKFILYSIIIGEEIVSNAFHFFIVFNYI